MNSTEKLVTALTGGHTAYCFMKKRTSKQKPKVDAKEAMALPAEKRPICFRISSEIYPAVFEAIGEALMCWNPRPGEAVFDSEHASKIATELCFKIADEVEGKNKVAFEEPPKCPDYDMGLRVTIGLLRASRGHIPDSSVSGGILANLDAEIARLESLLPPDPPQEQNPP